MLDGTMNMLRSQISKRRKAHLTNILLQKTQYNIGENQYEIEVDLNR